MLELGVFEGALLRIETKLLNYNSGKHKYSRNVGPLMWLEQQKMPLPPTKF